MTKDKFLNKLIIRRKNKVRSKIFGTAEKPRLSVFRSNRHSYVQLIDDQASRTLVSASTKEMPAEQLKKIPKTKQAEFLGELIAKKALASKIKAAIFDRGAYRYHGRLKALAEAARQAGLKF